MKNFIKTIAFAIVALFTQIAFANPVAPVPPITIPEGTHVIFVTATPINAKTASVNNSIRLKVYQDVKVAGKVVIRAGATTTGRIAEVIKNCDGTACERIVIEVESVSANGGNGTILLNSDQNTAEAPCCNGSAIIPSNTQITATVRQSTTIEY